MNAKLKTHRKYVLLTGASGGIGSAIAHQLAQAGYTLILQGRNHMALKTLEASLPHNHITITADLTCSQDREKLLQQAFAGRHVDVLVNNAGVSSFGDYLSADTQAITQQINVNLLTPMLLTQAFIKKCKQQRATVINIGSTLGSIGFPGFSAYSASKFGLRGFTEALAREFSESSIRIAYFAPRTTQTACNNLQADQMNRALRNAVDSPEDVAKAFLDFLHGANKRKLLGWPEKLFARVNGLWPELVDKALASKLPKIKPFLLREDEEVCHEKP